MAAIFHTFVYWILKSFYLIHNDSLFVDWRCPKKC